MARFGPPWWETGGRAVLALVEAIERVAAETPLMTIDPVDGGPWKTHAHRGRDQQPPLASSNGRCARSPAGPSTSCGVARRQRQDLYTLLLSLGGLRRRASVRRHDSSRQRRAKRRSRQPSSKRNAEATRRRRGTRDDRATTGDDADDGVGQG